MTASAEKEGGAVDQDRALKSRLKRFSGFVGRPLLFKRYCTSPLTRSRSYSLARKYVTNAWSNFLD